MVWTRGNPAPWNDVKPDENTKLMDPSGRFTKRFVVSFCRGLSADSPVKLDAGQTIEARRAANDSLFLATLCA